MILFRMPSAKTRHLLVQRELDPHRLAHVSHFSGQFTDVVGINLADGGYQETVGSAHRLWADDTTCVSTLPQRKW